MLGCSYKPVLNTCLYLNALLLTNLQDAVGQTKAQTPLPYMQASTQANHGQDAVGQTKTQNATAAYASKQTNKPSGCRRA